ncbi:MAG: polysaccharide biosynthesis tyrosine autokinase [Bacteroidota bacterium]
MRDENTYIEGNSEESSLDLDKFLLILRKTWYWIPVAILISVICGHFYLKYTKPVYRAQSLIKLEIQKEASNIGLSTVGSLQNDNLSGEIELIRSPLVAQDVLTIVDLNISYYAIGDILTTEIFNASPFKVVLLSEPSTIPYDLDFNVIFIDDLKYKIYQGKNENSTYEFKVGDIVTIGSFKFALQLQKNKSSISDQKQYFFRVNSKVALVSEIISNLNVIALNDQARTIQISYTDCNKEKARAIVNAFDTIYLKHSLDKKQKSQEQTLEYIDAQIEKTAQKLDEYESKLEDFVKQSGTTSPSTAFAGISEQMLELDKTKAEVAKSSKSLDEILGFIQNDLSKDNIIPLVFGLDNKEIADGINQLNTLFREREILKISNKDVTIPYRKIEVEISMIKSQLLNYVKENKRYISEQTILLNKKISELNSEFSSLPSKETELNRLRRFNSLYEKFYLSLIEKQIEYQISKAGTVPEFTILSDAVVSNTPVYPNNSKVWLFFILGGILPVVIYIVLKYLLMNVIYSQKQIESKLIAPILGSIPSYRGKMPVSTLVVDGNPKSAVSESLRSIRTNSDFMLPKKSKQLFGVTSTISGEGKTFFAINFAAIIALAGKRVVVLDLDMRKPKIHIGFNVDNNRGMSSILSGMTNWKETINRSSLKNLDFITAGPIPPNPNELLLKNEFDDLIDQLYQEYDVIMTDNPPIGLVTDASNVFKKCDLSIYIVRSGYSKENVITNINNIYSSKNFTNLSVVVNDVNSANAYGNSYGYGYGYGYGYYEEDNPKDKWYRKLMKFVFNRQ